MNRALLLLPLLLLFITGCSNDDEPDYNEEVNLQIQSIQNPKALYAAYESPDPGCGLPRLLRVEAGPDENDVVVKCTNFEVDNIILNSLPGKSGIGQKTPEQLGCSFSIIDTHTFRIHFDNYSGQPDDFDNTISLRLTGSRPLEGNQILQKETEILITRYNITPDWIAG